MYAAMLYAAVMAAAARLIKVLSTSRILLAILLE